MANKSINDLDWHISPDAFNGVNDSLANKLASLQQSIGKLGLRKERYADTIRQALKSGRLKEREISAGLDGKLQSLLERLSAKGLGKSGAVTTLSGQLTADAERSRKQAEEATAAAITNAQSQINQLTSQQNLDQEEIKRLLKQAAAK